MAYLFIVAQLHITSYLIRGDCSLTSLFMSEDCMKQEAVTHLSSTYFPYTIQLYPLHPHLMLPLLHLYPLSQPCL